MKILPTWLASWQEVRNGVNQFRNQLPHQNIQHDDLLKVQPILQWTNHSRHRRSSIVGETSSTLWYTKEEPDRPRATSEEPDSKKRNYFMVDIEELKQKAEVGDEAASPASSVEVTNIFDLQKHILSTRKVKSADQKCKEAFALLESDILSSEQQVVAWDKAKDERIAAARDAPRVQLETGPYAQIQQYRDEHARRQQEADEAHRRQILQVNPNLEQDPMGRVKGGFQPTNRLKGNSDVPQNTKSKQDWVAPSTNARAGYQLSQLTPKPPAKRQRIDPGSRASASPQSPFEVVDDEDGQRRNSSTARSGHSQTPNGMNESTGHIKEYQHVEETTNPRRGNRRNKKNRSGGSQKYKEQTADGISKYENAEDPIDDSDRESTELPASKKRSKVEVQIPPCNPEHFKGLVGRTNGQNGEMGEANKHKNGRPSSSGSNTSITSPYFLGNGVLNQDHKSTGARRTNTPMSAAGALKAAVRAGRGSEDAQKLDELSLDHLTDRESQELAQVLLQKPGSGRMPIEFDESEDDVASRPVDIKDIKPTRFKKTTKEIKSTEERPTYEIRQIFCRQRIWLRDTDEKVWKLEHCKQKSTLQICNDGVSPVFTITQTQNFHAIEIHEESCKVIILRNREHQTSNTTQLLIEFASRQQRDKFTDDMRQSYNAQAKTDRQKEYIDKVFKNVLLESTKNGTQPNAGVKRTREDQSPDDIQLAMAKSARLHADKWENAKRLKTEGSASRPIPTNDRMLLPKPRGMAADMKSNSVQESGHGNPRRPLQNREHPPEYFYRGTTSQAADKGVSHGTRSSRLTGAEPPPPPRPVVRRRTPSPEVLGWTRANPNWVKDFNWRKSIDYATTTKNRTTVEKDDIERLDEGEFLNDSLIGFYLGYLEMQLRKSKPEIAKRVYFQNSFFYKRLSDLVKGSKDGINYAAVEKWTSKVDIFKYDYIIVPVNEHLHWYVAIICHPSKLIEDSEADNTPKDAKSSAEPHDLTEESAPADVIDKASPSPVSGLTPQTKSISLLDEPELKSGDEALLSHSGAPSSPIGAQNHRDSSPPPTSSDIQPPIPEYQTKKGKKRGPPPSHKNPSDLRIITLDSFHIGRSPCCTKLKRYLVQELKAKKNIDKEVPGSIGMTAKSIPYQDNSSDCGLFLLNYVEMFLRDPDQFIKDICENVEDSKVKYPSASSMRGRVRDLLFEIQSEQHGGPKPRKTSGDSKVTAKPEKKAANSSTRGSNEPNQHNVPSAIPSTKAIVGGGDTKLHQGVQQSSAASNMAKPETVPDVAPVKETSVKNGPEATEAQKSHMENLYTNIAEGVAIVKNAILGKNRAGTASGEMAVQDDRVIEIGDSTQNSIQPNGESSSRPNEISDSQAPSSSTSSIPKECSPPQQSKGATETIVLEDSPRTSKVVSKSKPSARTRGTSKLESPTPPPQQDIARSHKTAANRSKPIYDVSKIPDAPTKLGSPELRSPSPEIEDEVALVPTFPVGEPLNADVFMADQQDEAEMLLPSQTPENTSGTRNDPQILSSPESGPTHTGKPHTNGSVESATSSRVTPDQHTSQPPSTRGTKRKSQSEENERNEHPRREHHSRGTSPDIVIIEPNAIKRQKKATGNDRSAARDGRSQMVEAGDRPFDKSRNEAKQKKSVGSMNAHTQEDDTFQERSSPFYRDALEEVMVKTRAGVHTRFSK